jgi:hypothetical protein
MAAILAGRGGYGLTRIAERANFAALRAAPKWLVGFSDVTALHVEALRAGVASLHAQNVGGLGQADAHARDAFVILLDTSAVIWIQRNHRRSRHLVRTAPRLYLSPASLLEIQFLVEDAVINGDGAGKPLGIMNSGAVVTQAQEGGQTSTFTVANAAKMYGRLWAPSMANAVWLMNQDVYQQVLQLSASNTLAFIEPGRIADAPRGMLLGRPIVPTEYNSSLGTLGDVVLADLSQYVLADKGGIQSASSIHVQFLTDQTCFRFVYRVDGQPLWNAVLTPYKGSNTTSPFVTLATH